MSSLDNLNRNQRHAAAWDGGPLLVLAGPGSGKTEVLALRVARLLAESKQASALALTSASLAAAQVRERVDHRMGGHTDRALMSTFHAFASDILRQHGSHLGIRPDFQMVMWTEGRIAVLEEAIRSEGDGVPPDRINLLRLIDRLFSESCGEGVSPSSLATIPSWLPPLFDRYCDVLVAANRQDYGSLIHLASRLLQHKTAVARVVRLGWTHVSVDEFQDTNRAQYCLLRLIAPDPRHNLFVVADDDQMIYQWNGASRKRFDDLRRDYDPKIIQLPESYRCPPEIVDRANRLIRSGRRLISSRQPISMCETRVPYADIIRHKVFATPEKEAEFVGRDIGERGLPPADCVVLGRTNKLVQGAADGIQRAGYEVCVLHRKSDFDSSVIGVLVEALRLANSRHDRVVLRRLCRQWERMTGVATDSHAIEAGAALSGGDFLRTWAENVSGKEIEALRRIRKSLVEALDFPEIVNWFLGGGWRSWGEGDPGDAAEEEVKVWRGLHRDIVGEGGAVTLNTYLQRLDLLSKTPPTPPNAVRCITVHQSQGLQFRHVYLIGMAQEVFPSYRALLGGQRSKEVEEERRSCFVAITRAQETLTLTRAREYFGHKKQASQFLAEMEGSNATALSAPPF